MALILHFGLFHLLADGWRKTGIDIVSLMDAPLRSNSLSEFWGGRWNSAFNRLAFEFLFRPIARLHLRYGGQAALFAAFLLSGVIHELVISLPAGAGYGLPTAYFPLQGGGILLEQSFPEIRGRIFTILITAVPAFPSAVRPQRHSAIHEGDWGLMKLFLQLAAAAQLLLLIASALIPRVLDWRKDLAIFHPFLRKLFWVYGVFIVILIMAFATLTFRHADAMAAREPVARSLCLFITVFWGARLLVQFAIFDPRAFLTNWIYQFGYHALTFIFAFLVLVYGKAAL